MNYEKIYTQLIERAHSENRKKGIGVYFELHHIVPKCIGGNNDKSNLVLLTAREHFIAHKLLCEIYPDNKKLLIAYWLFANKTQSSNQLREYCIGSREYARLKIDIAKQISIQNKGRKYSDAVKKKMSDLKTGTKRKPRTEEHRRNLSNAAKGKQPMLGKKHSDETKQKMRDTRKRLAAEKRVD